MENLKTVNSIVRTLILLVILGGLGYFGFLGYTNFVQPSFETEKIRKEMAALQVRYEQINSELAKTQTALKLIKVDQRKAFIKILEIGTDQESEQPYFDLEFVEVDKAGRPISEAREFRLNGTMMFVDTWVIKFKDKYIEQAEDMRSASLCVFKGLWGDIDGKEGGHTLDRNDNLMNTAYGTLEPKNEFEQQIWEDFWKIANDPSIQDELGIRANHGQINYIKVETGKVYEVDLRASDGLSLRTSDKSFTTPNRPAG